jgi:hypothetical protein
VVPNPLLELRSAVVPNPLLELRSAVVPNQYKVIKCNPIIHPFFISKLNI